MLLLVCAGGLYIFASRKGSTVIGLYGVSDEAVAAIKAIASEASLGSARFIALKDEDVASGRLHKKVDVLVTQNGALTSSLAVKAMPLPSAIQVRYPTSMRNSPYFTAISKSGASEFRVMPLLLDHFETAYFTAMRGRASPGYPDTLFALESYASASKEGMAYPMICAGALDGNLFGLLSVLVESYGGREGYVGFVDQMKGADGLDEILSIPIDGDAPGGMTFQSILDMLKRWQSEGLLLPEWLTATEATVTVSMEDNHAAVVFMTLSERRRKTYPMIRYFQGSQFPTVNGGTRAIVAPALCAMAFRGTDDARLLIDRLSSQAGQEFLSAATKLAPAALRGEAFDIQSDDVRYWAAATPGGPVPDIGTGAYADKARRSAIAAEIRAYLTRN